MNTELSSRSSESAAAVKWAAFLIGWCAACGLVIGILGSNPDGVARVFVITAKALILVALLQETIRSKSGWIQRVGRVAYTFAIGGLLFAIEHLTGGWGWSVLAGTVGAFGGAAIGGVIAAVGWLFDEQESTGE